MVNAETLRDFCGTLKNLVDTEDPEMLKAVEAWNITLAVVDKYCREYIATSNPTDDDIRDYARFIAGNVLEDIYSTGMFMETRRFMIGILNKSVEPNRFRVMMFCEDYFGDLANECCISEDDVNEVINDLLDGK